VIYHGFMTDILLPLILVLLIVPSDTAAIAQLGPRALAMMLIGTCGIVVGAGLSFGLLHTLRPADTWRGGAAMSGSWIGGSPNLTAVAGSLDAARTLLGQLIVVDTVLRVRWARQSVARSATSRRRSTASPAPTAAASMPWPRA
jgi:uncharacterized membrane protein